MMKIFEKSFGPVINATLQKNTGKDEHDQAGDHLNYQYEKMVIKLDLVSSHVYHVPFT